MKYSRSLAVIIASSIVELTAFPVQAQNINIQESVSDSFTFSKCVAEMCISELQVFQETVEEFIPGRTVWADFGEYSGGGTTVPPHWETYDRTRIWAQVNFPSCPNQHHLEGSLTVSYQNGEAYINRTHSIERADEGQTKDIEWAVKGYYGQPLDGTVQIEGSTECVYHGVNERGGPEWAPWNW